MKKTLVFIYLLLSCAVPVLADRYDSLMTKWYNRNRGYSIGYATNTDAMRLAWDCMNVFHAYGFAYEATGQKSLIDTMYSALRNNIVGGTRPNPLGQQGYLVTSAFKNSAATWWTDGVEYTGESFRIIQGVLHWVYLVKSNPSLQTQYGAVADQYLKKMEDTLVAKWLANSFIDERKDSTHDWHYPGTGKLVQPTCSTCAVDPYQDFLISSPHNKMADFGMAMILLYKITGKPYYREIITKAALEFKSKLLWKNSGAYYSWHYYDPYWRWDFTSYRLGGQTRAGVWIEHRYGYGGLDMMFAAECYRMGIVYNRTDIQRFVKTNRDIMWNGVTTSIDDSTWMANDGSVPIDNGGLYPALCPYDSSGRLANLAYNWYNTNYTSYGGKCGAPYFCQIMKLTGTALNPPDTLDWVGPLEVINIEPLCRNIVRLTFYNPVDSVSAGTLSNYSFSRYVTATGVTIDPADRRKVTIYTSPHDTVSRAMKLTIRRVKDIYGNQTFAYTLGNQPYNYNSSTASLAVFDRVVTARMIAQTARCEGNPVRDRAVVRFFTTPQIRPQTASICRTDGTVAWQTRVSPTADQVAWDCSQAQPGVYLVRIEYPQQQVVLRLMVTK
jgi:hypothetical protein